MKNILRFTVGSVTTAIFGILNGGMQIGQSSMYVEAVATAKAAAVQIFHVIDRYRGHCVREGITERFTGIFIECHQLTAFPMME